MNRIIAALLIGLCFSLLGCSSETEVPDPTLVADLDLSPRLVAFGDSLTQGSVYASGHDSFVNHVSAAVGVRVINAGKGGSRIADDGQTGRIHRMAYRPDDIVLFLSGYNDMRRDGSSNLSHYREKLLGNLNHMSPLVSVIFLGTCMSLPNYGGGVWGHGSDAAVEDFRAIQYEVAALFPNVVVVDTSREVRLRSDQYIDGVHPSLEGVSLIADSFIREM